MSTPGGLVDKQELIDAQLDTAHLGRVVNSKDASGAPINTSTNRTGGVNKTLDALEAEYQGDIDNFVQVSDQLIIDKTSEFDEAIQGAGGIPLGTWTAGVTTFTKYNEYAVYNGIPYKPRTAATLPYVAQGADPTVAPDDANVQPYQEITEAQVVVLVEETIPSELPKYTNIVYKALGGNSAIENMIAGIPVAAEVGDNCKCENGSEFKRTSNSGSIQDFTPTGKIYAEDFGLTSSDVQEAVTYCIDNLVDMTANSSSEFSFSSTVLIKQQPVFGESVDLSMGMATITMTTDVATFESAYDSGGGVLVSSYGTALEAYNVFGVKLHSYIVKSSVGALNEPCLRIQDWHQGTYIGEVYNKVSRQVLRSSNNFYCKFGELITLTPTVTAGARFFFENGHNLNDIRHLQAANSGFGYLFNGSTSALSLKHMSFEGMTVGAGFESTVYNCGISDSYFENITDSHLQALDQIESLRLSNNYFNFVNNPGAFLLDYLPGPNNNFIIEDDNTFIDFSDNQFFKTVDTTIGYNMGRITRPKKFSFSIDDFLVNNTHFPKSTNVIQPLEQRGLKTHQVNNFAEGLYAGRFTDGYSRNNGFEFIDTGSSSMEIRTKITPSETQRIYVNIRVSASGLFTIRGEFIGDDFYEYTATAQQKTSELALTTVGGFLHITGSQAATVTNVVGEVRLV